MTEQRERQRHWNGSTNGQAPPQHADDDEERVHHNTTKARAVFFHELPSGAPPKPLIKETFLAPNGWTVIYANGGVGKGMTALWLMREFLDLHDDVDIAVIDYEQHDWEWRSRADAMGFTEEEKSRLHYVTPEDRMPKIIENIKTTVKDFTIGMWVVDSYVPASDPNDKLGGADAAMGFFGSAALLGGVGLVLAHTAAGANAHQDKPFGSSFIHNAARETWSAIRVDVDQPAPAPPGTIALTPTSVMQVELRNMKRSGGPKTAADQLLTFTFWGNSKIEVEHTVGKEPTVADRILDILTDGKGYTTKQLVTALENDGGSRVSSKTIDKTLTRLEERSQVATEGAMKPYKHYSPQSRLTADDD